MLQKPKGHRYKSTSSRHDFARTERSKLSKRDAYAGGETPKSKSPRVFPSLLMLMPANQFIYIYLQHSNVSPGTGPSARGHRRLSARTTRESEPIPLAAGYEIRGVQDRPPSLGLIQIARGCWTLVWAVRSTHHRSIRNFMMQISLNAIATRKERYFHERVLNPKIQ